MFTKLTDWKKHNESDNNKIYSSTKNHLGIKVGDKVYSILGPFAGKNKFYGIVDKVLPNELYVTFHDIKTQKIVSGSEQLVYDYVHLLNNKNIKDSIKEGLKITGEYEGKPEEVDLDDEYLIGILKYSASEEDFLNKVIYGITDQTSEISSNDEDILKGWYSENFKKYNESKNIDFSNAKKYSDMIKILSQNTLKGNIEIDESYDIDPSQVNVKEIIGDVRLLSNKFPKWMKKISVYGDVYASRIGLTSLEGCPEKIFGSLDISRNNLTSLKGCAKYVNGSFYCNHNKLKNLIGGPIGVKEYTVSSEGKGGHFSDFIYEYDCKYNELTSLEGAPKKVLDIFNCVHNKIKSLEFCPSSMKKLYCFNNELSNLDFCPEKLEILSCRSNKNTLELPKNFDVLKFDNKLI